MTKLMHLFPPRCAGTTAKGRRCQMDVAGPGETLCRYHHPKLRAATIARNTMALRRYWERQRAAKALREAEAPGPTEGA